MLVHFGVDQLRATWAESTVCIGTFDGVHRGHAALMRSAIDESRTRECPSVGVTFDRHPAATLHPERTPPAIASLGDNLRHMEAEGIAVAVILPFDRALAGTSAASFFEEVLRAKLRAGHVSIGHDFGFGRGREGTADWLRDHIPTRVLEPVLYEGRRVSSSEIRAHILAGEVDLAADLLGRPYGFTAVVVRGQKLGRTLGFPTLNLEHSTPLAMAADGIYAGACRVRGKIYRAATSIGMRPTVNGTSRTVEAYLLDYPGDDVYGDAVHLFLEKRLRGEEKFDSLDALKEQMKFDVERTAGISTSKFLEVTHP
jgi:riboflavin kinase/FMN adenylyltransferase